MDGFDAALPLVIALGGGAGLGAGIKALVDTALAVRAGVSAKEGERRIDIVRQRDDALELAAEERVRALRLLGSLEAERARADWAETNMGIARVNEQKVREHAAELRIEMITLGLVGRDELPAWPTMESTIPRARLAEIQATKRQEHEHE